MGYLLVSNLDNDECVPSYHQSVKPKQRSSLNKPTSMLNILYTSKPLIDGIRTRILIERLGAEE